MPVDPIFTPPPDPGDPLLQRIGKEQQKQVGARGREANAAASPQAVPEPQAKDVLREDSLQFSEPEDGNPFEVLIRRFQRRRRRRRQGDGNRL